MDKQFFSLAKTAVKFVLSLMVSVAGKHNWPSKEPRLWVLMYHRVLPKHEPEFLLEEPGMIVTPETFRQHLVTLQKRFEIVDLQDWVDKARRDEPLPQKAIAITFDDGWADNYTYAFPILKDMGVTATIFLVSDFINTNKSFWPNRLQRILHRMGQSWTTDPMLSWLREICPTSLTGSPMSQELTSRIIHYCKQLDDDYIQKMLTNIELNIGMSPGDVHDLLDKVQINEMHDSGLISYGSHSATHRRLTKTISREITEREIKNSKLQLKEVMDLDTRLFCYPNGDINQDAIEFIQTTYDAAVTCDHGCNTRQTSVTQLKRIGIHENSTNSPGKLLARISGWN